jgi:benzodiazapine receptor
MEIWVAYCVAFATVVVVSTLPSKTMQATRSPWYDCIRPSLSPPNYVFPVVWTTLYVMIAVVLAQVFLLPPSHTRTSLLTVFYFNMALNVAWTFAYFGYKRVHLAFAVLVLLILTNVSVLAMLWDVSKLGFYMFIPYTAWLMFACVLNFQSMQKASACASVVDS